MVFRAAAELVILMH